MIERQLDIFLLMGQSNMAGRGDITAVKALEHPDVFVYRDGEWLPAREPLHTDSPKAGIGLGMSFAIELLKGYPERSIGLVPCAVGGTPLERWVKGGDLFERALAWARQAGERGTIKGVLWHQGESDCADERLAATYYERLVRMIGDLREQLGGQDVPVIVGEVGTFYTRAAYLNIVNEAIRKVANDVDGCGYVSSEGLGHVGDACHFNAQSQRELGRRYAREIKRQCALE